MKRTIKGRSHTGVRCCGFRSAARGLGPRSWFVVIVSLVSILSVVSSSALAQDMIRNHTPPSWQAEVVSWCRDVDPQNKIDDLIDDVPFGQFDVVVNFKRCVNDDDLAVLDEATASGSVQRRLKYISSVAMGYVSKSELDSIAGMPDVAFIEGQWGFGFTLDVSTENIKVTSGHYSPNTVEDAHPLLDGSGVNIVILDTGVDDVVHDAFNATPFVAGYDALTKTFVNPDDDVGHGTHVASIALGQATANTDRGVAPSAGLIDVKVADPTTISCAAPGQWLNIVDGLEVTFDNRITWSVDIINISMQHCDALGPVISDGKDAFSQMIDLAESMGIVVVAAATNNGPANTGLPTPAAATRAITVAGSNDLNTADRTDDIIYNRSSRGQRNDDGDSDVLDELKPEVTAPGENINAALFNTANGATVKSGTSMAAPHVAGLAALIKQAQPDINAASIKDMIISTAEARGAASAPAKDPVWNDRWGWGLVDAFEALDLASNSDLTYPNYPPSPVWLSPDIMTAPFPPQAGTPAVITVQIDNKGPAAATNARIHFGVHEYAATTPTFHDIGTVVVPNLPVGVTPVTMNWTPANVGHQCLKVEIGYGPDTDYSNNKVSRNINVAMSPVSFKIQNTLSDYPEVIRFETEFEYPESGWTVTVDPSQITLDGSDCPEEIWVLLATDSAEVPVSDTQIVHVAAVVSTVFGDVVLGGVSVFETVYCCGRYTGGITGNTNCSTDGKLNLSDITVLIDRVYISKNPLCCEASGNTNGSPDCMITLSDITRLIDAVYISKQLPEDCMTECE